MSKRGRKSAEELGIVCIDAARRRLEVPADVPHDKVAQVFKEIVDACSPTHFVKSDVPLLTAYATAVALSRHYGAQLGDSDDAFKYWSDATKMVAMLATRLRLTPQARTDSRKAGRQAAETLGYGEPRPWERHR